MIKPLLRTIPTLSGNVKLACTLLDYNKIGKDTFETNIRGAHIYPLSSQLFQKSVQANLLNSSWEYDLKRFYSAYSDVFFEPYFKYNKNEMIELDRSEVLYPRNTDFEYGVKRVSYQKSGCQYACFAPIYIDNVNDIPAYFQLDITLQSTKNTVVKHLRINIGNNGSDNKNYIYKYLYKYLNKIDDNVAFMDNGDKTVSYYGIDLVNGGFTKKTDSTVQSLFDIQMPIQLFDYTISEGFKRNNIAMRQCLPLCFYFDIENILQKNEIERYAFANVYFSGAYYDNRNNKIDWYDFDWDYDVFNQNVLRMNTNNGAMQFVDGYVDNIMDVNFPSFNDTHIINYQFANKLTTTFNRWKLKYSTDDYPYIINMSWAFSHNQDSNYKYKEFPVSYLNQSGYAIINENYNYNLIFPIGDDKLIYDDINSRSAKKYESIMNNYCLSWFDIIKDTNIENIISNTHWADTNNGYTYFNGVLYNLNSIYNKIQNLQPDEKIDKFAVLVYPNVSNIYEDVSKLNFVKYSINPDVKEGANCNVNLIEGADLFDIYTKTYRDNIDANSIFKELEEGETVNEFYVNAKDIGIDYYTQNIIYDVSDYPEIKGISSKKQSSENISLKVVQDFYSAIEQLGVNNSGVYTEIISNGEIIKLPSEIVALAYAFFDEYSYNALPIIFKEAPGIELYEELPIYRANGYINDDGTIRLNSVDDIYINTDMYSFNPSPLYEIDKLDFDKAQITYQYMLYRKGCFINKDFYNKINGDLNKEILYKFCIENTHNGYNISDIDVIGTNTYKLYNYTNALYKQIIEKIIYILDSANTAGVEEYEYIPVNEYNGYITARNICKKIQKNFRIIDDTISEKDNNVLYVHPYNLKKIFGINDFNKFDKVSFYGKMLNMEHYEKMISVYPEGACYKQYKVIVIVIDKQKHIYNGVKYKYVKIDNNDNDNIYYDDLQGMFYTVNLNNTKDYFNIVQNADYIKINKTIWDYMYIENSRNFKDLFVYRPLLDIEYDEKFSNSKILINDENTELSSTDTMLYPCFNDYYIQDRDETTVFQNWSLDNICEVNYANNSDTFYRYNVDNSILFVKVDSVPSGVKKYKKLHTEDFSKFVIPEVQDNYTVINKYNDYNIAVINHEGINYGCYILNVDINNTRDFFNIRGVLDTDINSLNISAIDQIPNLKFIKYINGIDITTDNRTFLQHIFKQLCPFIYVNLLGYINSTNTIIGQNAFNLTNVYSTSLINKANNSDERHLLYKKQTIVSAKKQILHRYTNSIIPHIKKTDKINNVYFLKYKDVNDTLIDTGKFNSIGDSVIYKDNININICSPINVYSKSLFDSIKSYNNVVDEFKPYEYKFYNNSYCFNLPKEFEITTSKLYNYDNLINAEANEIVFEIFKKYVNKYLKVDDNDIILFLYKKYSVSFLSSAVGTNIDKTNKIYKLTYKFNLL